MNTLTKTAIVVVLLLSESAQAQTPDLIGGQFQVNTYTTSHQWAPAVSSDMSGGFVVVWSSYGSFSTDTSLSSVQGQRYNADGGSEGAEFQVNSYTTSSQDNAAVASDLTGDYLVVWQSFGSFETDTDFHSIQARLYRQVGNPGEGGQFQVNTYTTSFQFSPAVAVTDRDNFMVVWASEGSDGSDDSGRSIQGRIFDARGLPKGDQFQVNTQTTHSQANPAVAADGFGHFVVVWEGSVYDQIEWDVFGRRYNADGQPLEEQFLVNTYTTGRQEDPAVATNTRGEFVVLWESDGSVGDDTSYSSIQGQFYGSDGSPAGQQFQVNTYTTSQQGSPAATFDPGSGLVAVWESFGSLGTDLESSIQAQRFSRIATPIGPQFQVNTYTTGLQVWPDLVMVGPHQFVVAWTGLGSFGSDGDGLSVQGQRFSTLIFTDGFESGDTTAWSSAVQ